MSNQKTLNEYKDEVLNLIKETKLASLELAKASTKDKDLLLKEISRQIEADYNLILEANKIDIENAKDKDYAPSFLDRLKLATRRLDSIVKNINDVLNLPFKIISN